MKALIPNGNLLVILFNGYGDAFLALPVLREISRRYKNFEIYLTCHRQQIDSLFSDLNVQFIAQDAIDSRDAVQLDLERLDFQQAISFNAYYPNAVDKVFFNRFPHIPRWGFCDAIGKPLASLASTHMHMRDQYFEVLGWKPIYSPADRQVSISEQARTRCYEFCRMWAEDNGELFYALHLDSLPEKTWAATNWAELISHIWSRWRAWPLIIGEESADASWLQTEFSFVHKLPSSIGIVAHFAAVALAKVFLGIDSIFAHVADSYGKPMTTLFGPSDAAIWGSVSPNSFIVQPEQGNAMSEIALSKVIDVADDLFSKVEIPIEDADSMRTIV